MIETADTCFDGVFMKLPSSADPCPASETFPTFSKTLAFCAQMVYNGNKKSALRILTDLDVSIKNLMKQEDKHHVQQALSRLHRRRHLLR